MNTNLIKDILSSKSSLVGDPTKIHNLVVNLESGKTWCTKLSIEGYTVSTGKISYVIPKDKVSLEQEAKLNKNLIDGKTNHHSKSSSSGQRTGSRDKR